MVYVVVGGSFFSKESMWLCGAVWERADGGMGTFEDFRG